jgi:ring-1,2-phenylacetyl-CoA epoxidase subunit PaaC
MSEDARRHFRNLLLTLADNKRLLGLRYSDCMLGSPSLETGIAASSMAQDEWGHSRLTYALLADFGDDPSHLEHERAAAEYHSIEALDRPFASYATMIAAALLLDGAITTQYRALADTAHVAARNRIQKLLDEEILHSQFANAWTMRLATSGVRQEFLAALQSLLPEALRWLGAPGTEIEKALLGSALMSSSADESRQQFLDDIGPVLQEAGLATDLGLESGWKYSGHLDWTSWDDAKRRSGAGGPDEESLARVRGDRNRAMLLD